MPGDPANADDEDDDDILIPREKTKDEIEREEEEYHEFLAREVGEDIGGLVNVERAGNSSAEDEKENDRIAGKNENKGETGKEGKKKRRGKERMSKEHEDHEFLMKYACLFFIATAMLTNYLSAISSIEVG